MTRGIKPEAVNLEELRLVLHRLHDPIAPEEMPFTRSKLVQDRAERDFHRRTCPLGLAASAVIGEALVDIADSLACLQPIAKLADGLRQGRTQAAIAMDLGLSEEQLSRHWKPKLLRLLNDRLRMMTQEMDRTTSNPLV